MNITLELTASPSLLEALRMLAGFANPVASFEPTARAIIAPEATQTQKKIVEKSQADAEERAANETTRPAAAVAAATAEAGVQTELTVEQVRAVTSAKAKAGKRAEVKELLAKYGAESVTNMDASNYAAFYAEIEAL
nr:hypothetical protein [Parabacteroides goldsteinii]